jgi:DNA polymerase
MKLWIDLETRSPIPIKHGVKKYATKVEVIMVQWAIDDGEVVVEDLTRADGKGGVYVVDPSPELQQAISAADELWAHGAEFEQQVLSTQKWYRRKGISRKKWRCTMALARMHGLPGGLDKLSTIFKLDESEAKDKRGYELIRIFCIPLKSGFYYNKYTHPVEWAEFKIYGGFDITSMRAVYRKCPKWNSTPRMWAIWHLDQRMNARGVKVDLLLAQGAVDATTRAKKRLKDQVTDMTLGAVETANQRNRMLAYLSEYGVDLPDLTADTVERRLEDEALPEHIKELLRIRQQASKASTAKYQRVITQSVDGRLHNLLVAFGAARTGRWAARTFQPQNLPRPKHKQWEIDAAIEFFRRGEIELYDADNVLGLASSCLRGIIIAAEGRKLVVSDLANIEGRDMAWIAGEDWKLEAFRKFDRKEGPDLYKVSYARAFNIDPNDIADEGDWRRQIGKVMELALQYYGGVGAFLTMAETYGLRLEALAAAAWPVLPDWVKVQASKDWQKAIKRRRTYGIEERIWVVCQALVILWRKAHPKIVQFWKDLEDGVREAVKHPGKVYKAGRVEIDRYQKWLRIKLPSGRYLSYPAMHIAKDGADFNDHGTLKFTGVNPYTKQWGRIATYSGKLAENIVQGSSADVLMDGLLAADEAEYNPVLSVHDEIIAEPLDDPKFDDKKLSWLMTHASPWAKDMPLAAKGFTGYRYRK